MFLYCGTVEHSKKVNVVPWLSERLALVLYRLNSVSQYSYIITLLRRKQLEVKRYLLHLHIKRVLVDINRSSESKHNLCLECQQVTVSSI